MRRGAARLRAACAAARHTTLYHVKGLSGARALCRSEEGATFTEK